MRNVVRRLTATLTASAVTLATVPSGPAFAAESTPSPTARPSSLPGARMSDNPFTDLKLTGLHAEERTMWPAGNPVRFWALVLNEDLLREDYAGGEFFLYAPDTGYHGWFLVTDIPMSSTPDPYQVVIADTTFLKGAPQAEVRYGIPQKPDSARVVATVTNPTFRLAL
ncbi:hypothetical protein GCM10009799_21740 [Nocardiopsis rhodophaea]|uniref:Secreted protein n=2 Tax=Nocardiopsis rhodophaea TaxID=280238 RepID=A0ABN2SZD9_9ACTN